MIITGDCLTILPTLPSESVQMVCTSPPYYGLRDYGCAGQIGLEATPEAYVEKLVLVAREIWRVLRPDGTLWLNLGDSYASGKGTCFNPGGGSSSLGKERKEAGAHPLDRGNKSTLEAAGLKPKDLIGIPWRVAFALQADGWYLRQDIIWSKPNPMPESVTDRCTKAHEYIFLLTKSERYFYDHEAVKLQASADTHARYARGRSDNHKWSDGGLGHQTIAMTFDHMRAPGVNPKAAGTGVGWGRLDAFVPGVERKSRGRYKAVSGWDNGEGSHRELKGRYPKSKQNESFSAAVKDVVGTRARRNSDWFFESWQGLLPDDAGDPLAFIINPRPFKEAHFATFPETMVEPCIRAGSRPGDTVLDPFSGSGTTGNVAERLGRKYIGIDINAEYNEMGERRVESARLPLFGEAK